MTQAEWLLHTLAEAEALGSALGGAARPGDVLCLDGDLGAGKTTLSQAIARGLDVSADCYVTSPSFAILHEYPGRIPMYHMDFYRLYDEGEVIDLGFEEYFYGRGLSVIEWSERAREVLPPVRLHLTITITDDGGRHVLGECHGGDWWVRLKKILGDCHLDWREKRV